MKIDVSITTMFLDVGVVILAGGYDRHPRIQAAPKFELEMAEVETQHHLTFETYREGTLPMGQYLESMAFPLGSVS